jgi:hypothetical protein
MTLATNAYLDDEFFMLERIAERTILQAVPRPPSGTELRMQLLKRRIDFASEIQEGWDSYASPPPSPDAVKWARRALDLALIARALPSTIVPSADGGIALCWDSNDKHAYIEFDNDGSAVAAMYQGMGEPDVKDFLPADPWILEKIGLLQQFMRV